MFDRVHTTRLWVAIASVLAALTVAAPAGAAPTGVVCTNGVLAGTVREFDLTADKGTMETPDGNSNLMWSYRLTTGGFQTPGPILCANAGETVSVTLHNTLPDATSIVFPGQKDVVASGGSAGLFTREAAATNGSVTYSFTAANPGTYVYESGTDPSKQVEMGLASALIVYPAGHSRTDAHPQAYATVPGEPDANSEFDPTREYLILLNEIDPDLHSAVENGEPFDILTRHNRYFTVNGRSFPDTLWDNDVPWLPTQPYGALVSIKPYDAALNPLPALIRIINVGLDNHPFHPHGQSLRFIAQDGHPVGATAGGGDAATEHFGDTVPSGATEDYLLKYTDQDNFSPAFPAPTSSTTYEDQVFKDANTWYSGSPYLGTVGDLPDSTTSQNVCGAFFFPWHSHALNEFANYEAGFGGMATMLRVDPQTGCATPGLNTYSAVPASVGGPLGNAARVAAAGSNTVLQRNAAGLAATGGPRYTVTSTGERARRAEFIATFKSLPLARVSNMHLSYVGRCRTAQPHRPLPLTTNVTCNQTIRIWKWSTRTWVVLDARSVKQDDLAISGLMPPGANSQYISPTGEVRVGVLADTPSPNQLFTSSGDLMQITYDAP